MPQWVKIWDSINDILAVMLHMLLAMEATNILYLATCSIRNWRFTLELDDDKSRSLSEFPPHVHVGSWKTDMLVVYFLWFYFHETSIVNKTNHHHTLHHNILRIHDSVLWDWHYYASHSINQAECEEYFVEYCQSHKTLLWIWIMLWLSFFSLSFLFFLLKSNGDVLYGVNLTNVSG